MNADEYVNFHKARRALANNEAPNRKGRRLCRKARELDRQYRREKDHLNAILGYDCDPSISELWECKRSTSIQYAQLTHAHLAAEDRLTRKMMQVMSDHDARERSWAWRKEADEVAAETYAIRAGY